MSELKLTPEVIPMIVQGGFYLAALVSSHYLLIKPLVALSVERKKRTQGAVDSARGLESKLELLEKNYRESQQFALTEARDLKNAQVLAGQAEAQSILLQANETAKAKLQETRTALSKELEIERAKIPALVNELADAALARLSRASLLIGCGLTLLVSQQAFAGGAAVDPMYGILWPYFQFIVFVAILTFFARKAIAKMLADKRENLRTKLSEAKEARILAERRVAEYESKLKNLQSELEALRKEFASDGVRQRDKLIAEARAASDQILRDSERIGHQLIHEARTELKKDVFEQVLNVLNQKLSNETLGRVDAALKGSAIASLKSQPHTN
jgi:F-type H+-transporting ATPase subunit b